MFLEDFTTKKATFILTSNVNTATLDPQNDIQFDISRTRYIWLKFFIRTKNKQERK